MTKVIRIILVSLTLIGGQRTLHANDFSAQDRDHAAHFGVSYAIQTVSYGFSSRALRLDRGDALIFSFILTNFIGLTSEMMQERSAVSGEDLLMNALGSGAAVGTILFFSF